MTDAQGNTSCYRYDERGRKIAEWGTGIQPVCYAYDSVDRLVSLTTFRVGSETINADPTERSDGDVTTWHFDAATGLELSKTYADNSSVVKTYDAFNRLATETDARGIVKTHSYEVARGLLLGTTYSNSDASRCYAYNHLGQLTQVTDESGVRTIGYNSYSEQETDSLLAEEVTHLITETRDSIGRSSGYTYANNGSVQQTVSTGYGDDGRIASAGFVHSGAQKLFTYSYLPNTNLLQTLVKPNNMTLTQSYEEKRDLLISQLYNRSNTCVASRAYTYDSIGHPVTRSTSKDGATVNDSFGYNSRSELNTATVNNAAYAYDYDNIGNRESAQEAAETATTYESNRLNQYTTIGDFEPTYDDAGNQTKVKTSTGIWSVVYNAENRPTSFTNADSDTIVECSYDYMGRRATKKVTVNGSVTLHQRFLYRGYLQIACCDLTRSNHPCLCLITWDPFQPVATRPLAIQKDGTWYTYGWDLTKNICEVYGQHGYIRTNYSYSPYGEVTISGDVTQPIQWSSEYSDSEIDLVYYNYRHYSPLDGKWIGRDMVISSRNEYLFCSNASIGRFDFLGLVGIVDRRKSNVSNCLGGAMTNCENQYRYPHSGRAPKDNMIDAMRKNGWNCHQVKNVEACQCKCEEAKILITLYKNESLRHQETNPWTSTKFPWRSKQVDLHAIRSDVGCRNDYKQIPRAATHPQKFDKEIPWSIFKDTPLLCCCEIKEECPVKKGSKRKR